MVTQYLMPTRRVIELIIAVYAGGYGMWVWGTNLISESTPLGWTGITEPNQIILGQLFCAVGLLHSFGIWLNGNWRYSPALRLAGMLLHSVLFVWLASHSNNPVSTAIFNYMFLGGLLLTGSLSAVSDCRTAFLGSRKAWTT